MSAPEKLRIFLKDYTELGDRELQMSLLIECAERFKEVPPNIAVRPFAEERRVPGCESEAFIWAVKNPDHTLQYYFAVENPQGISAKALAVILDESLSGSTREEVSGVSEEIVFDLFGRNISMGKGQGLMNMVKMVRGLAK